MFFRSRIMSAVQSTTLPWMLWILNMTKNLLKTINPFDFCILLWAFLYGNIFAIQCSTLDWGFVFIFGVVLFLETVQRFFYLCFNTNQQTINRKHGTKTSFWRDMYIFFWASPKSTKEIFAPFFLLNTMKRGFLLGFFLEAFKVGS